MTSAANHSLSVERSALSVERSPDWAAVMAGLTGARLAVYDELLRQGAMELARIEQRVSKPRELLRAVRWLAEQRFLLHAGGNWQARPVSVARELYEQNGPAATEEHDDGDDEVKRDAAPVRLQPALHMAQTSWF